MSIYLDIDGVLLANDKEAARHADKFFAGCFGEVPRFNLLADDAQLER